MAKEESFSDNLMAFSGGAPIKYSDNISFGSAFADARKKFGEEGLFIWRDKIYSTKGKGMTAENQFAPANQEEGQVPDQEGEEQTEEATETGEEQAPEEESAEETPVAAPKTQPTLKKANNNQ